MVKKWVDVKGYEGIYLVSNKGEIKQAKTGRILKATYRKQTGCYVYGLKDKSGNWKQVQKHIVLADSFNNEQEFRNLKNEKWATVSGDIQVSSYGRLRVKRKTYDKKNCSFCKYRLLVPSDNGKGYLSVKNSTGKGTSYVHRLVATAFIPNPKNLPEVNHKDGNKSNNKVSNLEWVSRKGNTKHALDTGLMPSGVKNWNAKLNDEQVRLIYEAYHAGVSSTVIMKAFGVTRHCILDIANEKRYKSSLSKFL